MTAAEKELAAERKKNEELESEYLGLQKAMNDRDASVQALKNSIARLELSLLEKEVQIKECRERQISQQKMMDEAVLEVVRAKAKLRSLESKAEAASNMAEAEIAVKALKVQLPGGEQVTEVKKAEELLKMSAGEFAKENYGGALYLINQARSHIKLGQMRIKGRDELPVVAGEEYFVQPVPLQVLKKSNLREGPDVSYGVITILAKGTHVVGYSYKGNWIRVKSDTGTRGWIFRALVGERLDGG